VDFDATAGIHGRTFHQIKALDDGIGKQFGGGLPDRFGRCIGIDQKDAAGRNAADVGAEIGDLLAHRLAKGISSQFAHVDAMDHGRIVVELEAKIRCPFESNPKSEARNEGFE